MRQKTSWVPLVILLLGLVAACTTLPFGRTPEQSFVVTGASLEALGTQFLAVTKQVTEGCNLNAIPSNICTRYRLFGEHFKASYPVVIGMWEAAYKAGNDTARQRAEETAVSLSKDLAAFMVEILNQVAPEVK